MHHDDDLAMTDDVDAAFAALDAEKHAQLMDELDAVRRLNRITAIICGLTILSALLVVAHSAREGGPTA